MIFFWSGVRWLQAVAKNVFVWRSNGTAPVINSNAPDCRIYTVINEVRSLPIAAESRTMSVDQENRTLVVVC